MRLHIRQGALLAIGAAVALTGCNRISAALGPEAACSSDQSADSVKALIFQHAAATAPQAYAALLPQLARDSTLTLEHPLLVLVNHETGQAVCEAQAHLRLPPGVRPPIGVDGELIQPVRFSSQGFADGSGRDLKLIQENRLSLAVAVADASVWARSKGATLVTLAVAAPAPLRPTPAVYAAAPAVRPAVIKAPEPEVSPISDDDAEVDVPAPAPTKEPDPRDAPEPDVEPVG